MVKEKTKKIAPAGCSVVCPCLSVESVEAQMEFLVKVFNAEIIEDAKGTDDFIHHGEVRIGDTTLMLSRASKDWPAQKSNNFVFVENADEVFKRGLENGASALLEPEDRFYGIRDGGFTDPFGNQWWAGKLLEELEKRELDKRVKENY